MMQERIDNFMMTDFYGKTIVVSGATGLIGQHLVRQFRGVDKCRVIAIVRDREKAERVLGKEASNLSFIVSDIRYIDIKDIGAEYIIHAASLTDSRSFVEKPVEVISVAYEGTRQILELARKNPVKSLIFLSTMEVYGTPQTDNLISETYLGSNDTMNVRSAYPESKRLCENLCCAYHHEYGVPIRVLRLSQTFGSGVDYNDQRVFAEFARCVIEGKDIILHTKGQTKRSYLEVTDACNAVLTVLKNGSDGEAYNAANEETYCSIKDMALLVAQRCAEGKIEVRFDENEMFRKESGYADTLCMNLSCEKLRVLGWKPRYGLIEMYNNLIEYMKMQVTSYD